MLWCFLIVQKPTKKKKSDHSEELVRSSSVLPSFLESLLPFLGGLLVRTANPILNFPRCCGEEVHRDVESS